MDLPPEELTETLPLLCDPDRAKAKRTLQEKLNDRYETTKGTSPRGRPLFVLL